MISPRAPALSLVLSGLSLVVSCSSSSSPGGTGGTFGTGPALGADQVGGPCSGVGTSPGDTAAFSQSDCPAGFCIADARTSFDTYCSADCEARSCPAGYVCGAVTLGALKHACLKDPNATADSGAGTTDSGAGTSPDAATGAVDAHAEGSAQTCTVPPGTYAEHPALRNGDASCPPATDTTLDVPEDGGVLPSVSGCTASQDAAACAFTQDCSTSSSGFTTKRHVVLTYTGGNLSGTLTVTSIDDSTGETSLTCTYDLSFTRS